MKRRAPFYVFLAILGVLSLFMLRSVLVPAILAVILGYLLFPVYRWMRPRVPNDRVRAALLVFLVLVAIAMPILYLVTQVASELPHALQSFDFGGVLLKINNWVDSLFSRHVPIAESVDSYLGGARDAALHSAKGILGVVGNTLLALLVLLYALYYVLLDGPNIWRNFLLIVPLSEKLKPILVADLEQTLTGVLHGQFFTAVLLGLINGIGYWIFHVSHVPFWMFLTAIFAVIPIVGPNVIWLPLSISRFVQGDTTGGLGVLIFCGSAAFIIDNLIKPRLIAGRSEMHPLVALLGVMGGLEFFGLVGFIFGPVLLSLVIAMLRFHRDVAVFQVEVVEAGVSPRQAED